MCFLGFLQELAPSQHLWTAVIYMTGPHTLLFITRVHSQYMPLQHFPITYKAETKAHMSSPTLRNIPALFSSPHTTYLSRYTTICDFSNRGKLGL